MFSTVNNELQRQIDYRNELISEVETKLQSVFGSKLKTFEEQTVKLIASGKKDESQFQAWADFIVNNEIDAEDLKIYLRFGLRRLVDNIANVDWAINYFISTVLSYRKRPAVVVSDSEKTKTMITIHKTSLDRLTTAQAEYLTKLVSEKLNGLENPYNTMQVVLRDSRRDESGKQVRTKEDLTQTANIRSAHFTTCLKGKGSWGAISFAPKERGFNHTVVYFSF